MIQKNINISYMEYDGMEQLDPEDRILVEAAMHATRSSYAPYSKFNVGAAVRLSNDEIVEGSNQENMAYPSGLCAERTAMFYASARYPEACMTTLAITAAQKGIQCPMPVTPCGSCRQVMAEYQTKGGHPIRVILAGKDKIWIFRKVDDILPFIFDTLK